MDADRTTAYLSVPICGETFQVTDREGDEWIVACIESADRKHFYGGFLVVKCQDTIQDGKQVWVHSLLSEAIEDMGFALKDLAVVVGQPKRVRWPVQKHLDKTHSYFLVFRKGGLWPFGQVSSQSRSNLDALTKEEE